MSDPSRELYREHTPWPRWLRGILLLVMAGAALGPWIEDAPIEVVPHLVNTGLVLGVVLLVWAALGGLTVVVTTRSLNVGLGRGWPIRTRIPLADIQALESVDYRPLRQFGGWGVRGTRERRVWSSRGDRAVRLELADGRTVLIGSDEPEQLEARIRRAVSLAGPDRVGPGTASGT